MIRAVMTTALWMGALDAVACTAILGFLYTPESNVLMLVISAVLIVGGLLLLALSSASGAHGLVHGCPPWRSLGPAARRLPLLLSCALVIGVVCGVTGWFGAWWVARSGEVDAAAIVAGNVTRTQWLHATVRWAVALVQWVIVPAWLAASLVWVAGDDARGVLRFKWLKAGLHWRLLLATAATIAALVWLPWRYVYWRPGALPASSVELAFTIVKLTCIYLLVQVAWALILWTAARRIPIADDIHRMKVGAPP